MASASQAPQRFVGRASDARTPNRFERVHLEENADQLPWDAEASGQPRKRPTELLPDRSQTLIRENDSPDIPFRYSVNPYRGCEHGCAYCYARPGHETLGMNAGIDFETIILVNYAAPQLLRQELCRPTWQGDVIAMSGVTDCYQPAERKLKLTRACLEIFCEAQQAVAIVTKNALVLRDLDLLVRLAQKNLVHLNISMTTLDAQLARTMEPRTPTPATRLRTIRQLTDAGIPVRALIAPVIPGLTDQEVPRLLAAARDAGARAAGYQLLRLPLSVAPVFLDWLSASYPQAKDRVEGLIRQSRHGRLNDAEFGRRMRGEGPYAEAIRDTFRIFAKQYGLLAAMPPLDSSQFRPPRSQTCQLRLF